MRTNHETTVDPRSRWIVDARTDVAWFIAPVLAGYLFLCANRTLGVSSFVLWWLWNVTLNGPHFWATVSRTYLDRDEWRARRALFLGSLGWVLVGPLAILASIGFATPVPFVAFWIFQVLWAYFHVVRQHYGFMVLYQHLNGENAGTANTVDFWSYHVLMLAPVVAWFLWNPEFRTVTGRSTDASALESLVLPVTVAVLVAAAASFLANAIRGHRRTGRVNVPKALLLGAYVPLHVALMLHAVATGAYDVLLFQTVVTAPHNLQYLAIVWVHNRNRYGAGGAAHARHGFAAIANASVARFAVCAAIFSLTIFYSRFYLEGLDVPFGFGRFAWAESFVGGPFRVADVVAAAWIGIAFNHQHLDQRIWKVSRDPAVVRDLRLDERLDGERPADVAA